MITVLIVEDNINHIKILLDKLFKIDTPESLESNINKDGEFKITKQLLFNTNQVFSLYICNNRDAAIKIIDQEDILFCFLDIYIPQNVETLSTQLDEYGADVLEALHRDKTIFTFLNSSDRQSLSEFFNDLNSAEDIRISQENIQFIDKSFIIDDEYGYQTEYYFKLLSNYIESKLESTRCKLIIQLGYFKGLDHIAELYEKLLQGEKDKVIAKLEFELKYEGFDINVKTEFHPLKSVLLHKPGAEIKRVTPVNKGELLFDQPVDFSKFVEQYKTFSIILEEITKLNSGNVFYVEDLLSEILTDPELGTYHQCLFILTLIQKGFIPLKEFWKLITSSPDKIIEIAIVGQENGYPEDPIPNFIFTRDNIITVHNLIFLPTMTKKARKRENALMEFVLLNHPLLHEYYADDFSVYGDNSFEGGDFILFDEETIFVGISDRTTIGSVRKFAEYIFENNDTIKTIVGIEAFLQHERSMHLDTYMGVVGDYILILNDPLVSSEDNTFYIFTKEYRDSENYPNIFLGNFKVLLKRLNKHERFEVIQVCEKREAYDDACNVLSIGKNQILTYDRGTETINELGKRGFIKIKYDREKEKQPVWEQYQFEDRWIYKGNSIDLKGFYRPDEKYIFEIKGSELILARGGCHCMSMPFLRIH